MHTLDWAVVDVLGADAETFLQAQTTNNLAALAPDSLQLNGYCSPKGRLLALFWQWRIEDGVRIVLPADVVPSLIKRWTMYVLRSDVRFEVREDWMTGGLTGDKPQAPEAVFVAPMPSTSGPARWLLCGSAEALAAWGAAEGLELMDAEAWRAASIRAGMPSVVAATVDHFIPQMLDLEALGGLSFTKGCYPGQEIVARAQYRGTLKRHLSAWHGELADGALAPEAGTALDAEDGRAAMGEVVDAVCLDGQLNLLAVVKDGLGDVSLSWQGVALERAKES